MPLLGLLGGVGQGISAGVQDLERMDEQQFMRDQRKRMVTQQKLEDEAKQRIAGLRKVGDYEERTPTYEGMTGSLDEQDIPMKVEKKSYSASQRARDIAGILQDAQQYDKADQYLDRSRSLGQQEYSDAVMKLIQRAPFMSVGDYAKEAAALKTSDGTPINAQLSQGQNGQLMARVYNSQTGQFALQPVNDHAQISNMLMASTSPEAWRWGADQEVKQGTLANQNLSANASATSAGAAVTSANAAKTNAETNAAFHGPNGTWFKAQMAHVNATLNSPHNQLAGEQLKQMQAYNKALENFETLAKDPKANMKELRQAAQTMALRHPKEALVSMKVKDADGGEHEVTINRFDSLVNDALTNAGVVRLPAALQPKLTDAVAAAKGDPKKFLNSPAAKEALALGVKPDDLVSELMPQKPAAPAPAAPAPAPAAAPAAARNPYVDATGRPTGVRVPGDNKNALETTVIPGVKDAALGLTRASDNAGKTYLQGKLDRGEKLNPAEEARAKIWGLTK